MTTLRCLLALLPAVFGLKAATASDWPTYGGPNRNHCALENTLRADWGEDQPEVAWELEVGLGYSSVVESNGAAYTQGYRNGENTLYCVDASTGKVRWTFVYPSALGDKYFQGGSRSTPTISGGKVFLQGHEGPLFCLDAQTGRIVWQTHLVDQLDGILPTWGYSGAPLAIEGKVIVQTGAPTGSLVALDERNGKPLWKGGTAQAGYSSPCPRALYPEQILVFNQHGLSVHDLNNGEELLSYPHKTRYEVNAAQPLDLGERALLASAYGKGAVLLNLIDLRPRVLWESSGVACQMASMVQIDDRAYGINGQTGANASRASLFCLDLKNGRKIWEEQGFGVGTLILVDGILVVMSDRGELTLIKPADSGYLELSRFQVLSGKNNWTPPSYANGRMHCRSSAGKWVCLKMGR